MCRETLQSPKSKSNFFDNDHILPQSLQKDIYKQMKMLMYFIGFNDGMFPVFAGTYKPVKSSTGATHFTLTAQARQLINFN